MRPHHPPAARMAASPNAVGHLELMRATDESDAQKMSALLDEDGAAYPQRWLFGSGDAAVNFKVIDETHHWDTATALRHFRSVAPPQTGRFARPFRHHRALAILNRDDRR